MITVHWWVQTEGGRVEGERAGVTLEDAVESAVNHIKGEYPVGAARVYSLDGDNELTQWRREGFR